MKKILAVLISVLLIFTSVFTVSVSAEESEMSYDTPVVIIRGIAFTGLTIDEGTPDEKETVVLPETNDIVSLVLNLAKTYFVEKRLDVDAIAALADDALGGLRCDENGNSVYNVSYSKYPLSADNYPWLYDDDAPGEWGIYSSAIDKYGADKVYFFTYDWRLDPTDIADDLHAMIERAKTQHNSDKVDIVCCSMGGVIADCYIYEYGYESIDTIVFDSSTFCGTHFAADLFQGKVLISPEMILHTLTGVMGSSFIPNVLYLVGVCDMISDFAMKIVDEYKDEIYDKALRDLFVTMPMLWAIGQASEYEACVEYLFPTAELKAKYAGLLDRVDNLHETLIGMNELLVSLPVNGVKVAVVAAYNAQMPPVYESAMTTGDTLLESDLMLGRAVVGDFGGNLGINYVGERVSADKCIDLSNALFPEYTWAIKNGTHIIGTYGTDAADLVMSILGSKVQPTVNSFARFPQFMIMDEDENLLPLE